MVLRLTSNYHLIKIRCWLKTCGWMGGQWFLSNGLLLLSDCEETFPKHCHHCYALIAATQLVLHSVTVAQPDYSGLIYEVTWPHTPVKPPSTPHHRRASFVSQHWSWRVSLSSWAMETLRSSGRERAVCPVQHADSLSALYLRPLTVFCVLFQFYSTDVLGKQHD